MSTFTLTLELAADQAELAESLLQDLGALGLEIRDAEIKPMPGQRAPKEGCAIVVAYFDGKDAAEEAARELQAGIEGKVESEIAEVVEQDWSESWKAQIRAVTAGRLWVGPPWQEAQAPQGSVRVVIEPGMAFGTGDHPTTHYCLEAVDRALSKKPGASVLDVGTGSAVLAIAARKLGAGRVVGTDNDPVAIRVALENAERNGAPNLELSTDELDQVQGPFDIVLANILANTLCDLAAPISAKVAKGGVLVLAGILDPQADEVVAAYLAQGLQLRERVLRGEWAMLELGRAP